MSQAALYMAEYIEEIRSRNPAKFASFSPLVFSFKEIRREDIPQYQPVVLREAVLNALVHADYANIGTPIYIAIFVDRLEITNPGALPLGMSLEIALTGVSQL